MRQRPDQQVRGLAPAPVLGRVGQLDPVPLGLLPGRVLDHRDRPALDRDAPLARHPQTPDPQLPGQRRVRAGVAEPEQLVEQGRGPQVRVVLEALSAVRLERLERVRDGPLARPRLAAGQVRPDRLTVPAQVRSDRRDRPPLPAQRVYVDVFLPCEHEQRGSLDELVSGQRPPASKEPHRTRRSHTGGEFQ
jgi:hypothetical protein